MIFLWDFANVEHIGTHGIKAVDAEYVVRHASGYFPRQHNEEKWIAWGQTESGMYLQVIYTVRTADQVEYTALAFEQLIEFHDYDKPLIYVIHSRPLTPNEIGQFKAL